MALQGLSCRDLGIQRTPRMDTRLANSCPFLFPANGGEYPDSERTEGKSHRTEGAKMEMELKVQHEARKSWCWP